MVPMQPDRRMQNPKLFITLILFIGASLLAFWSWPLVVWSANEEPFYGDTDIVDAFLSVGLGSILIFLWIVWSTCLVTGVIRRKISFLFLPALILPVLAVFFLRFVVFGYLQDRAAWEQMQTLNHTPTPPPAASP
jgi:hypothetical protein